MKLPKYIPTKRVLFAITGTAPTDEAGTKAIANIFGCEMEVAARIKGQFVRSLCKPKLR